MVECNQELKQQKNLCLRLDLCFVKVINVLNRGVHYSIPVPIIYYIQHSVSASAQTFIRVDDNENDRRQNSIARLVYFWFVYVISG